MFHALVTSICEPASVPPFPRMPAALPCDICLGDAELRRQLFRTEQAVTGWPLSFHDQRVERRMRRARAMRGLRLRRRLGLTHGCSPMSATDAALPVAEMATALCALRSTVDGRAGLLEKRRAPDTSRR
jgi:hypothetical protein